MFGDAVGSFEIDLNSKKRNNYRRVTRLTGAAVKTFAGGRVTRRNKTRRREMKNKNRFSGIAHKVLPVPRPLSFSSCHVVLSTEGSFRRFFPRYNKKNKNKDVSGELSAYRYSSDVSRLKTLPARPSARWIAIRRRRRRVKWKNFGAIHATPCPIDCEFGVASATARDKRAVIVVRQGTGKDKHRARHNSYR